MPDQEPLPDAPEAVWAGAADAQLYFSTLGMPWLAPFAANWAPRMVIIEELCALPPPATSPITLSDLAATKQFWDPVAQLAAERKMQAYVDRGLWEGNCRYTSGDPVPPTEPSPEPPGIPEGPEPPQLHDRQMRDVWKWVEWMRRQMVSRNYLEYSAFECTDTGSVTIDPRTDGDWTAYAAGVRMLIEVKPDWVGRSSGGEPAMFWDLGWASLGHLASDDQPFRIQRQAQITWGHQLEITRFTWNLLPGVTMVVWPLYPETTQTPE